MKRLALALLLAGCGGHEISSKTDEDLSAVAYDFAGIDGSPGGARDWTASPAIAQVDTSADIYAVGDVHGDYDTVVALLVGAGIIAKAPLSPSAPSWTAGNAVLVCTGDLVDKGPRSLDVIALFQGLATVAAEQGGRVIVTTGNHEAEFLAAPDPTRDFDQQLVAAGLDPNAVAAGLVAPGPYLRNLPFAARVNDWFFAHAGNTNGRTLSELSSALQQGIEANGWSAPILSAGDSILEARLSSGTSPWWGASGLSTIATYAQNVGATHLVMGHQPGSFVMPDGATRKADALTQSGGVIYFIDVGMSVGVDDTHGPLLHIHDGTATAVWPTGKVDPL